MPLTALILLALAQEPVLLAELPQDLPLEQSRITFAPGGSAFALTIPEGLGTKRSWRIWQDGELGEPYDFLDSLRLSQDGSALSYRRGQVLEDGRQSWEAVLNGRADGAYDWVGPPTLRPDGREIAYWAGVGVKHDPKGGVAAGVAHNSNGRNGGSYFLVQGGKESENRFPSTPELYPPAYRSDGKELAHLALLDDGLTVIVGKKEYGPYQAATGPVYAPTGKKVGWAGVPRSGRGAVFLGKKSYAEGAEALGAPSFDAKGKNFAYPTKKDGELVVEFNEEPIGPSFGRLGKIRLSADGDHIAYIGSTSSATSSVSVAGQTIVLDDMMLIGDEEYGGDRVSWSLVVDGQVVSGGWNHLGTPVFSPDGKTVAVAARKAKDWHLLIVAIDKDELIEGLSDRYDAVGSPRFSKTGALTFGAREGRKVMQITLSAPQAK